MAYEIEPEIQNLAEDEVPVALQTTAPPELKMYCVFSKEAIKAMKGNRGKLAAQAGHAYLHAFWDAQKHYPEVAEAYFNSPRAYKVCLSVETTEELYALYNEHFFVTCGTTLVKDAGLTVFDEPTVTCVGIGPIYPDDRSEKLKSLRPLI